MVGFLLLGAGALVADAYYRVRQIAEPLNQVRTELIRARVALGRGTLPQGDPFNVASGLAAQAQHSIDHADFAFRFVGKIPYVGRPVQDLRLGVQAAGDLSSAAAIARDMVEAALGPAAAQNTGPRTRTPAPIFHDGKADLALIRSLPARFTAMLRDLQSAERALRQMKPIPFYARLQDTTSAALSEDRKGMALAQNGLAAARLLPSFLGADHPRTYFLALQNNSDQRATGGAVLAYALVTANKGKLELGQHGSISDIDNQRVGFPQAHLPEAITWYIEHVHPSLPRLANSNYSPDFPVTGRAWQSLVEAATGVHIDGAIAVDPIGIAGLLGNRRIRLPLVKDPVTGSTAVPLLENQQYLLPRAVQDALPSELIGLAWERFRNPGSLPTVMRELGKSTRGKHLQLWSAEGPEEELISQLGWAAGLSDAPGDRLYLTDSKFNANKVDYYTHASVTYDVTVDPSGSITSSYSAHLVNAAPPGLPGSIVGRHAYALNKALIGLYVPKGALLRSSQPAKGYPDHVEGGSKVFLRTILLTPGHPRDVRFDYEVPGVVMSTKGGRVYQLTVQEQPFANPADLTVKVTLPRGATIKSAAGWSVSGNVATYHATLDHDVALRIVF